MPNFLPNVNPLSYLGVRSETPPNCVVQQIPPSSNDKPAVGSFVVDEAAGIGYQLVRYVNGVPDWQPIGGGSAAIQTINLNAPIAGNYTLAGTASQITVAQTAGTSTFSIPAAFIAPGSISATTTITAGTGITSTLGNIVAAAGNINATLGSMSAGTTVTAGTGITSTTGNIVATAGQVNAGTTMTAGTGITATTGNIVATAGAVNAGTSMTATLGNITATNGNLVLGTAGNKINITTGANASAGTATLTNGTVVVATTAVTASSIILLTRQTVGTTGANDLGILSIGAVVAATSFEINAWTVTNATALQADDQSVIGWVIIN